MATKKSASGPLFEKMGLGGRLRWLMERRQIKQVDLAARAGVTQAAISNLVTDQRTPSGAARKPRGETLVGLARELGTTPSWLLDGIGDPFRGVTTASSPAEEISKIFDGLSAEKQRAILATVRAMAT